jgi:hypothetical protein
MKACFLLWCFALGLFIGSCELADFPNPTSTEPESQLCSPAIEEVSVYDHLMFRAHSEGSLNEEDVAWFAGKLMEVGIDITIEPASDFEVFEWGKSFGCRFGRDIVYYHTDDAEPPPEEEESFEKCVENCIRECMEGVDPDDPLYDVYWKLCNRDCRIVCAHKKNPKGRFSRKPS